MSSLTFSPGSQGRQRMRVRLAGKPILLVIWWAPAVENWYISVFRDDKSANPIVLSRQIKPWVSLVRRIGFAGELFVVHPTIDPLSGPDELGRDAWESGWIVYYTDNPPPSPFR